MKAAVYLRISQDQTGESLGVTRQREDCTELARTLGWDVAEVYVDNDISATSGKARPEYLRMLADCDAGSVEAIIAWHPDRLYRKVSDLGGLIDVCKRNNVQIATAKAGTIDLTTPTGRLVAGLLAQVATYEGEAKSDRWRRSIRQRRDSGAWSSMGPRMYGWDRDGQVIEAEAQVIRELAAAVLDGATLTSLARDLETRDIKTTRGNHWQTATLRNLLTNPRLAGLVTLNGDIMGRGNWQAILDVETWETVRALLAVRRNPNVKPRVSILVGLIHCGKCGERMVTGGRGSNGGPRSRTYRCQNIPGRLDGCGGVSINADPVEEIVEAYARARLNDPQVRDSLAALHAAPTGAAAELNDLEQRLQELEGQLAIPGVPVATIMRAIDRTKERLETVLSTVTTGPRTLPTTDTPWPTDVGRRAALIALVVQRVTIMPAAKPGAFDVERVQIEPR